MLLFAGLSPLTGRLIDRFGPRSILFVCAVTQSLSSAVTGVAAGLCQVYLGRFLFEVKNLHASQVLINRCFVRKRGRAQGIVATGMPVGALILSPIIIHVIPAMQAIEGWTLNLFQLIFPLEARTRKSQHDRFWTMAGKRTIAERKPGNA